MSILATIDGTTYSGIDTITTGGKTIALTESGGGGGGLPSFMNHMDSGTFSLENGSEIFLELTNVTIPKVVLIYSNDFDIVTAKASKPLVGSYWSLFIAGTDTMTPDGSQGNINFSGKNFYCTNWGNSTDEKYPSPRKTLGENRGIRAVNTVPKKLLVSGFGSGEYDFQYNVTYNWIAWD